MLPCIDANTPNYLAQAENKYDLVARLRKVFSDMGTKCFNSVGPEMDVQAATLYAFVRGSLKEPSLETLHKMVKYLAPAYEIALVLRDDTPPACAIPARTKEVATWKPVESVPGWEAGFAADGSFVAGAVQKIALATAAE